MSAHRNDDARSRAKAAYAEGQKFGEGFRAGLAEAASIVRTASGIEDAVRLIEVEQELETREPASLYAYAKRKERK